MSVNVSPLMILKFSIQSDVSLLSELYSLKSYILSSSAYLELSRELFKADARVNKEWRTACNWLNAENLVSLVTVHPIMVN